MSDEKSLQIMCSKCDTVFIAGYLPLRVDQLVSIINSAKCPHCKLKASKSNVYSPGINSWKAV